MRMKQSLPRSCVRNSRYLYEHFCLVSYMVGWLVLFSSTALLHCIFRYWFPGEVCVPCTISGLIVNKQIPGQAKVETRILRWNKRRSYGAAKFESYLCDSWANFLRLRGAIVDIMIKTNCSNSSMLKSRWNIYCNMLRGLIGRLSRSNNHGM